MKQKKELQDTGYIVIETNNLEDIKMVDSLASLDGHMLLRAALKALEYGNDSTCRHAFGTEIRKELQKTVQDS